MNVLVIEDNEQGLYLVRLLLESRGHQVFGARDGPEGIAAAQESAPDVILLDIQLPHMDGHAVARALRALPSLNSVPIIAVTSYAMGGDRAEALAAGCDAYIEKPIDPDTFVTQVERVVSAGR
ncbi:MAG: response regulator [Proteobacteria bacterium]|nr:response regulator [Pseudomonadota bacterium]